MATCLHRGCLQEATRPDALFLFVFTLRVRRSFTRFLYSAQKTQVVLFLWFGFVLLCSRIAPVGDMKSNADGKNDEQQTTVGGNTHTHRNEQKRTPRPGIEPGSSA